ncbi:MAG: hypothetical protein MUC87_21820 [Bacteroidia bacterium]|jgi:hypothetical protein|nr:hypothetical protein [Bacteroidia bacterium]
MANFELVTWYDTWNQTGLDNLVNKKVPLYYATRYNLAFGSLVAVASGGYSVEMGSLASQVLAQIAAQAPGVRIYAGLGSTGIVETVNDNNQNNNRSTNNIAAWLLSNGYSGISIDAEEFDAMQVVPEFITQLGDTFNSKGLGIAVSVPWPANGPQNLYGNNAVSVFNQYVEALELQDYSSGGTPNDVGPWTSAGVRTDILMGGVSTENGNVQTPLPEVTQWTQFAAQNGLKGMFSWRLDNDHGLDGQNEDVDPTFTGAMTVAMAAQPFVPNGTYKFTSKNVQSVLMGEAQKIDQSWVPASFDLTNLTFANLANMNGELVNANTPTAPAGYLPGGSYLLTSRNMRVILMANCQKIDGSWQRSQLDITTLSVNATINNINGVLTVG